MRSKTQRLDVFFVCQWCWTLLFAAYVIFPIGHAAAERYDFFLVPGTDSDQVVPDVPQAKDAHPAAKLWSPHSDFSHVAVPNTGDAAMVMLSAMVPEGSEVHFHVIAKGAAPDAGGWTSGWTGANTTAARQASSAELASLISSLPADGHRIGFAYSHGDTVLENGITGAKLPFDSVVSVAAPGIAHAPDDLVKTRVNFVFDGDRVVTNAGSSGSIIGGPKPSPGIVRGANSWNVVLPAKFRGADGELVDNTGPVKSHAQAASPEALKATIGPALAYLAKAAPGLKSSAERKHLISLNELMALQCDDKACREAVQKSLPPDSSVRKCLFEYTDSLDRIDRDETREVAEIQANRERYDYGTPDHKRSEGLIQWHKEEAVKARLAAAEQYQRCLGD